MTSQPDAIHLLKMLCDESCGRPASGDEVYGMILALQLAREAPEYADWLLDGIEADEHGPGAQPDDARDWMIGFTRRYPMPKEGSTT